MYRRKCLRHCDIHKTVLEMASLYIHNGKKYQRSRGLRETNFIYS